MIVYCLTTHRNIERQTVFHEAWRGWDVRFVHGPDYRDLPCQGHERVFALTCCLCGHLTIWRMLVEKPGWHLVTEDDAVPLPNLADAYRMVTGGDCDYQVVKLHHPVASDPGQPLFPLPPDAWVSTTAYLVRDTGRLLHAVRFLGSPDRMLAQIATVGAVFPPAVRVAGTSTMPRSFCPEDATWI